ncbi:MAG: endolytic transglycosylase MltG [Dysgonomonas sp.]
MKKQTRTIFIAILIGLFSLVLIVVGYGALTFFSGFNVDKTVYILIDKNKNYNEVLSQLESKTHISNIESFNRTAKFFDYPQDIKSGRYAITPHTTILQFVRILKNGSQTPVKLKFNNLRTKGDLTERLSSQLMISNQELGETLNDSLKCVEYGFTIESIGCMFIPNTYEVYWDVSLRDFLSKMYAEYKKFWTESRLNKAKEIGLTPTEVSILASIVEEECFFSDEYPIVAGLYLNRLNKNMLLQADPTIKFSINDFSIKRILGKHIEQAKDSPYSTYAHKGLPPGPIRIPSIKAIDAVLNPVKSDYIFMCAKEDFSGRHNFAITLAEHEQNRVRYHNALNQRKIF